MKFFLLLTAIACLSTTLPAQDLTVRVVSDNRVSKPLAHVVVQLVELTQSSGRRRSIAQRSDNKGIAVFHNVDLNLQSWQLVICNVGTASDDPGVTLASPENAVSLGQQIVSDPIITALPAEVTIHVRKRGFGERLDFLFRGP